MKLAMVLTGMNHFIISDCEYQTDERIGHIPHTWRLPHKRPTTRDYDEQAIYIEINWIQK